MTNSSNRYRLSVSVGVCVYNEEKNIARLLRSLLAQKTDTVEMKEIIIISSGSTDRTDAMVSDFLKKYRNMKLLLQKKREGKASALNLFFEHASHEVLAIVNGDIILKEDSIEKLVSPFHDPKIGMTGGRPIPVNDRNTFMGFVVHLLWNLHHLISLGNPKLGELIALRNVARIPCDTAVDEAWMEAIIKSKGLKVVYVPDAIVYNRGPETVSDFLKQRRRIFAGHLHIKRKTGYKLSTMDPFNVLLLTLKSLKFDFRAVMYTLAAVLLELMGRALGFYDFYIRKRNPYIWDAIKTTKEVKQ